jgi:4-hydroxy-3-methylbut-2-enyl diphosphate reductase IspH
MMNIQLTALTTLEDYPFSAQEIALIVGGRDYERVCRLVHRLRAGGTHVYHINGTTQLQGCWFKEAMTVWLAAGTSNDKDTLSEVQEQLRRIACARSFHFLEGVAR